jgi:hypothetical protein
MKFPAQRKKADRRMTGKSVLTAGEVAGVFLLFFNEVNSRGVLPP